VLRNYVLGVVKTCGLVRDELCKGNVYDVNAKCNCAYMQEEDASTNTASLTMLNEIDVGDFSDLLQEAMELMEDEVIKSDSGALNAIWPRLHFRKLFLTLVSEVHMAKEERSTIIETCLSVLQKIIETMDLGKPTAGAFSPRIQKRLSICVPPRPMVSIDPKEAAKSVRLLLEDLVEIDRISDYNAPHEILVSQKQVQTNYRTSSTTLQQGNQWH
jgi:hypothetical protein